MAIKKFTRQARALTGNELGQKLLQSVREMKAGQVARVTTRERNEVAEARHKTGLSQSQFSEVLKISTRTLQEWEQGRRHPSGPAQALIEIALRRPDVIMEARAKAH